MTDWGFDVLNFLRGLRYKVPKLAELAVQHLCLKAK